MRYRGPGYYAIGNSAAARVGSDNRLISRLASTRPVDACRFAGAGLALHSLTSPTANPIRKASSTVHVFDHSSQAIRCAEPTRSTRGLLVMLRARLDARRKRILPRCSRACRRAPPLPRLRHKSGCPGPRCGSAARYSYVKPRRVHAVSIEPSTMSCMQLSVSCSAWGTTATCGGCCGEPNIQRTTRELVACRARPYGSG